MDSYKLLITGGVPLTGETYVSGGKNTSVAVTRLYQQRKQEAEAT